METKISKHGLLWPPRDPASAISHLLGFVLAVVGTVFLIIQGNRSGGLVYAWSFGIFGLTMTLLYLASASYHWFNLNERGNLILRKLDHAMIYVLIAGSYTPLCIIVLKGIWGTSMLASIWAIALGGIFGAAACRPSAAPPGAACGNRRRRSDRRCGRPAAHAQAHGRSRKAGRWHDLASVPWAGSFQGDGFCQNQPHYTIVCDV